MKVYSAIKFARTNVRNNRRNAIGNIQTRIPSGITIPMKKIEITHNFACESFETRDHSASKQDFVSVNEYTVFNARIMIRYMKDEIVQTIYKQFQREIAVTQRPDRQILHYVWIHILRCA